MTQEISREEAEEAIRVLTSLHGFKLDSAMRAYAGIKQIIRIEGGNALSDILETATTKFAEQIDLPLEESNRDTMRAAWDVLDQLLRRIEIPAADLARAHDRDKLIHRFVIEERIKEWTKKYDIPHDHYKPDDYKQNLEAQINEFFLPLADAIRKQPQLKEAMHRRIMGETLTQDQQAILDKNAPIVDLWDDMLIAAGTAIFTCPTDGLALHSRVGHSQFVEALYAKESDAGSNPIAYFAEAKRNFEQSLSCIDAASKHLADMHDASIEISGEMIAKLEAFERQSKEALGRWKSNFKQKHELKTQQAVNYLKAMSPTAQERAIEIYDLIPRALGNDPIFDKTLQDYATNVATLKQKVRESGGVIHINSEEFFNVYVSLETITERFGMAEYRAETIEEILARRECQALLSNSKEFAAYAKAMQNFVKETVYGSGDAPIAPRMVKKAAEDLLTMFNAPQVDSDMPLKDVKKSENLDDMDRAIITFKRMSRYITTLHDYAAQQREMPGTEVGSVKAGVQMRDQNRLLAGASSGR